METPPEIAPGDLNREQERLVQLFDREYYAGMSRTNSPQPIMPFTLPLLLIDYVKWTNVVYSLARWQKTELHRYRILDAGCGNANALAAMCRLGADPRLCYGIDASREVIAFARERYNTMDLRQGLLDSLPYPDNHFDLVFNFGVLIHVLDDAYIRKITTELSRVIKPDGLVFVIVSDSFTQWNGRFKEITRNFDFTTGELAALFAPHFRLLNDKPLYRDFSAETFTATTLLETEVDFLKRPESLHFHLTVFKPA